MTNKLGGKIKRTRWTCLLAVIVVVTGLSDSGYAQPADAVLVDGSLTLCGDGITWGTAYRYLQDAIDFASDPVNNITQIWVARGTYYPSRDCAGPTGTDRAESFDMIPRVSVYGGFDGTETVVDDRNYVQNPTILSGDIDENDVLDSNNSWHVLTYIGSDPDDADNTRVDGFTITMGKASGLNDCSPTPICVTDDAGGGAVLYKTLATPLLVEGVPGPTFENCTFINNRARGVGGAIAGRDIGVKLVNCTFDSNVALSINSGQLPSNGGGAVSVSGETSIILCNFINNTSHGRGGAVEWVGGGQLEETGDVKIVDCKFFGNKSYDSGGGMYLNTAQNQGYVVNSVFANNEALAVDNITDGGGIWSTLDLINCTFVDNKARDPNHVGPNTGVAVGGGAFLTGNDATIVNCVFWGNSADNETNPNTPTWQLQQVNDSCPDFSNIEGFDSTECNCAEGDACSFSINFEPSFVDPNGADDVLNTIDDDYSLFNYSYGVEAGNTVVDTVIPDDEFDVDGLDGTNEPTPDPDFNKRVLDSSDEDTTARVDMGAYEGVAVANPWDCEPVPDTFVGVNDFLALLAQWGQPGSSCDQLPGPGVGVNEFLALLAAWTVQDTIQDVVEDAGLEYPGDWDDFVDIMTDPDPDEALQANWSCWMDHYLDCHAKPFCFECALCQICPDADPWGYPMH